jgi:hypothetical protein
VQSASQTCPLTSSAVRDVARWWLQTYDSGTIPSRCGIDLTRIRRALPFIWLVEYQRDADDFRYRLAGEHVNDVFGRSLRGRDLREVIAPAKLDEVYKRFRYVVDTPGGVHCLGRVYMHIGTYREGERLILPLADDGDSVTHLLGVTNYRRAARSVDPARPDDMDETYVTLPALHAWHPQLRSDIESGQAGQSRRSAQVHRFSDVQVKCSADDGR